MNNHDDLDELMEWLATVRADAEAWAERMQTEGDLGGHGRERVAATRLDTVNNTAATVIHYITACREDVAAKARRKARAR